MTAFVVITLVVPIAVAALLRRTPLWWLSSVAVALVGWYVAYRAEPAGGEGLGDVLERLYGLGMIAFAGLLLIATVVSRSILREKRR